MSESVSRRTFVTGAAGTAALGTLGITGVLGTARAEEVQSSLQSADAQAA